MDGRTRRLVAKVAVMVGLGATLAPAAKPDSTNGWGFGYDSLLTYLARWRAHPAVRIDSIGASVQGRALWMLTITEPQAPAAKVSAAPAAAADTAARPRVFVHARTHPAEVQANYVANAMIGSLLDTGATAAGLRRDFIFHIIPMYNPDGVELGLARTNANHKDLEGNWAPDSAPQPERLALQAEFQRLMAAPNPVRVALNLHSDQYNCDHPRYFVFHAAAGTSVRYTQLETEFISGVRHYFRGIDSMPPFAPTWGDGTQVRYPEGWWWTHYREGVMALTYEDANCTGAGEYDSTGRALALGSADYIRTHPAGLAEPPRAYAGGPAFRREGGYFAPAGPLRGWSRWSLWDLRGHRLGYGNISATEALRIPAPAGQGGWLVRLEGEGGRALPALLLDGGP